MMALNDCCSCAWLSGAVVKKPTASKAAAAAQNLFTVSSSIHVRSGWILWGHGGNVTWFDADVGKPVQTSAPRGEELAPHLGRLDLADAAVDLRSVQAGGRGKEAYAALDRAALGIGGAVIKPPDAGERDRRRAHGAGLQRHIEVAVDQPLAAEGLRSPADRHDLGMRGRVAVGERAIAGLRDQIAVADDHAADRHLAGVRCRVRLVEREIHESVRRHGSSKLLDFAITPLSERRAQR